MKKYYFIPALFFFFAVIITEIIVSSAVFHLNLGLKQAVNWHYFAILINLMIIGAIFYRQTVLREIDSALNADNSASGQYIPLSTVLWIISWLIISVFLLSFLLSFFDFFQAWISIIPVKFHHLFQEPAIISAILQAIFTVGSKWLKDEAIYAVQRDY